MKMKHLLVFFSTVTAIVSAKSIINFENDASLAKYINSLNTTWRAGRNFEIESSKELVRLLSGTIIDRSRAHQIRLQSRMFIELPESFDAREQWANCPTIGEIRDQGCCGSCWAVSSAAAISDRICIHSNGTKNFHASSNDLNSCENKASNGCNGGDPYTAYAHWTIHGLVSGGEYHSDWGCQPYPFEPNFYCHKTKHENVITESCSEKCTNPDYDKSYENDLHIGSDYKAVKGEKSIMQALYESGPLTLSFQAYADFRTYKSGVYKHEVGEFLGGHAVKVVGWGVEDGVKYWNIANSWGTTFGENGYFRILRGADECGIESEGAEGFP